MWLAALNISQWSSTPNILFQTPVLKSASAYNRWTDDAVQVLVVVQSHTIMTSKNQLFFIREQAKISSSTRLTDVGAFCWKRRLRDVDQMPTFSHRLPSYNFFLTKLVPRHWPYQHVVVVSPMSFQLANAPHTFQSNFLFIVGPTSAKNMCYLGYQIFFRIFRLFEKQTATGCSSFCD